MESKIKTMKEDIYERILKRSIVIEDIIYLNPSITLISILYDDTYMYFCRDIHGWYIYNHKRGSYVPINTNDFYLTIINKSLEVYFFGYL